MRGGRCCADRALPARRPAPKRALTRQPALAAVAGALGARPAEVALAWLLDLSPGVVAIPGARTPEAARSAARAAGLLLRDEDRVALAAPLDVAPPRRRRPARAADGAEVVVVMGIPGAGKTRAAAEYVERGFARLNRDERGGSLRDLAEALDGSLAAGTRAIVLDNTYLTRASRSHVVDVAVRHGASASCVWLDIPLAQAQVNLVERLLDRFGALPAPAELRRLSKTEQGVLAPTSQMRALRGLEPPSPEEGFAEVRRVPFERERLAGGTPGLFVARSALRGDHWERAIVRRAAPTLLFDWSPDGREPDLAADGARLAAAVGGPVETGLCPHGGGPPICWCRPPLPGLLLAFARAHGVDPAGSALVGTSPAHRTLAETLGAQYLAA